MRIPDVKFSSRKLSQQNPLLKGTDVRHLQQTLKHLGFYKGRVDGAFGFQTRLAVIKFQKAFKRKPTGTIEGSDFEILQELKYYNIDQWNSPRNCFANTGYFPTPLPPNLKKTANKSIKNIISITSFANTLILTSKEGVYAFDLNTLKQVWKNTKIFPKAASVVRSYRIYIPAEELITLDIQTGKVQNTIPGSFCQPVSVQNNKIYAPTDSGTLLALKSKGNLQWKYNTQSARCSTPAIANNLIYFSAFDRSICCLDKKGIPYWKQKLPDIIKIPLALWQNRVYAISISGSFFCFDAFDGTLLWQKKLPDEEYLPPAFLKDELIATDYRGNIYCIGTKHGELRWIKNIKLPITSPPITCPTSIFIGTDSGIWTYNNKTCKETMNLEGHIIKAIAYSRFDLFVATDKKLIRLSPDAIN